MFTIQFQFNNGQLSFIKTSSLKDAQDKIALFKRINPCIVDTRIFDPNYQEI